MKQNGTVLSSHNSAVPPSHAPCAYNHCRGSQATIVSAVMDSWVGVNKLPVMHRSRLNPNSCNLLQQQQESLQAGTDAVNRRLMVQFKNPFKLIAASDRSPPRKCQITINHKSKGQGTHDKHVWTKRKDDEHRFSCKKGLDDRFDIEFLQVRVWLSAAYEHDRRSGHIDHRQCSSNLFQEKVRNTYKKMVREWIQVHLSNWIHQMGVKSNSLPYRQ